MQTGWLKDRFQKNGRRQMPDRENLTKEAAPCQNQEKLTKEPAPCQNQKNLTKEPSPCQKRSER